MSLQLQQHYQQVHICCGVTSSNLCTRNHKPLKFGECGLNHLSHQTTTFTTLDLLPVEELDGSFPHPLGWQKFLNLESGSIYYKKSKQKGCIKTMSRNGKAPKLDLRLNLSPPRANEEVVESSPTRSTTSPPSSCISSEMNADLNSPEVTSMMLVGCPRCLMYVMLSQKDPKCPKCKSTGLLDFLHENTSKKCRKN
ncbi:E3 ubiquitin-protein ligase [Thalictrum thalictroides]|uniref:E3 ubiquitin-protein ligase n=1 Tax=Thalictrum thalictroides TaxID=46969 RepID=A0A7J6UVP5_THATH|nr:E3 ubiquitin-protein ligase [Thalictrum thalictroides]